MRQTISGLVAAIAVMAASAVPAMACGGGLFQGACSPCGQSYVSPCAQTYYEPAPVPAPVVIPAPAPVYSGCNSCNSGWAYERLPDPVQQYYYADQGPTFTGPGDFAPLPVYREGPVYGWGGYHHHSYYGYHHGYRYGAAGYGYGARYGYAHHHGYMSHYSLPPRHFGGEHRSIRYGGMMAPHYYGQRERMHHYN